jgi:hypothetical protein
MRKEIPILCSLTDAELQNRRQTVLRKTARSLVDFTELENGFRYRFPADEEVLQNLATVINLERKCCPFLNFKLILEAGSDFAALELTGGKGTKETLVSLFNWNRGE